ncbi:MAG: hypothetical protein U0T73_12205 [Chitinophagales bacterium]
MHFEEERIYHIYNRSVNSEALFKEESDYYLFLKKFEDHVIGEVALISYCLMPTHFHFVFQNLVSGSTLRQSMQNFLVSYAKSINFKYQRHGSLFQHLTKSQVIDSDDDLESVINYVHQNPVAAGLCATPGEWRFSSYNAVISTGKTHIAREEVLDWFGGLGRFIEFHEMNKNNHWVDGFHFNSRKLSRGRNAAIKI